MASLPQQSDQCALLGLSSDLPAPCSKLVLRGWRKLDVFLPELSKLRRFVVREQGMDPLDASTKKTVEFCSCLSRLPQESPTHVDILQHPR